LALGSHHRHAAALNLFGPNAMVVVDVSDLDNDTMIRMLAEENFQEWDHDLSIEVETVRAVLQAASEGKISLPPITQGKRTDVPTGGNFANEEIAKFLGRSWSNQRVGRCTAALRELGDEVIALHDLRPSLAGEVIRTA
jgi:hypothetical protein